MGSLWSDVRFAIRGLKRSPGFTAVAVLTLALGIGAATGVFSAVNAVLLAAMPYPHPERLVLAHATFKGEGSGLSGHDCFDYAGQATSFESLASHLQFPYPLPMTGRERPENVRAAFVSVDLFRTLGVAPALGRTFTAAEGAPAPAAGPNEPSPMPGSAIVSHALWQRRLGGSPDAVGSTLTLAGRQVTVVGVMPEGFHFLFDVDVWLPQQLNGPFTSVRRFHNWFMVGRLRPGVTLAQAQSEVDTIAKRLETLYPESNTGMGVRLNGLHDMLVRRVRPALLLVTGAVALMLLIACGNVASLLLARGVTRRGELAVRGALGASRGRLVRQLVTESVVVALLGGACGLVLAALLQRVLPLLLRLGHSRVSVDAFHLDPRVLAFAVALSLLTGIAVGILPALRGASPALFEELKGARTVSSGRGARARLVLVGVQVGLSFVLLLGSTLLIRSFGKLMRAELGFDPDHLLATSLALPGTVSNDEAIQFYGALLDGVRALPGVTEAGIVDSVPIREPGGSLEIWTPEHPEKRSFSRQALGRVVLPGYLAAMRIPFLAGRDVAMTDREGTQPVMVIDRTMARTLFEGEPPLGRTVLIDAGDSQPTAFEVVGVVADAQLNSVGDDPHSTMYVSFLQYPKAAMRLLVRTGADPGMIAVALRALVAKLRPDVPVDDLVTMASIVRDSTLAQRALTALVTCFALFALLLAAVGLFGVLSYQVNQRRHELGLRVALGASPAQVLTSALRQGLLATAAGLAAGAAGGLVLARLMRSVLFEVSPADPASVAGALAAMAVVALAACALPAARAARVEPMQALRYE